MFLGHIKIMFCDSKDVAYILICKTCNSFYVWQTQDFKQRFAKHKLDALVGYSQNILNIATKPSNIDEEPL